MELYAAGSPDYSGYCIYLDCVIPQSDKTISIKFLIDTGCTITNLSYQDFLKFGIDINQFEQIYVFTSNGKSLMRKINDCKITFETYNFLITEKLREIHIQSKNMDDTYDISQLGLNFLKSYSIKFKDKDMILEK